MNPAQGVVDILSAAQLGGKIWIDSRTGSDRRAGCVDTLVRLLSGASMPLLGLGTWPMDEEQTATAVEAAIEAGYRLVDTAEQYGNERGVAEGLRRSGIDRDEVFITSKFNKQWHSRTWCEAGVRECDRAPQC